jgi:hypothetical protein
MARIAALKRPDGRIANPVGRAPLLGLICKKNQSVDASRATYLMSRMLQNIPQ